MSDTKQGTVKWFNNAKGYGFNLQYGSATDSDDATISSYTGTSFTVWMLALDLDNNKASPKPTISDCISSEP